VETGRIALIRYVGPDGVKSVGSGLVVGDRQVLTADHVAEGADYRVERDGGEIAVTSILRSCNPDIDLAVLTLSEPTGLGWVPCGRVNRRQVDRVTGCAAVGFPRWKKDDDRRIAAQVYGSVPTAEGLEPVADAGLRAGYLTLVGDRIPGAPAIPADGLNEQAGNPWGGMSGAGVYADDIVIGVVRSHNLAAGGQSLTVAPVTAVERLPDPLRGRFWAALGVDDPDLLAVLPDPLGGTHATTFNAQVLYSILTAHQDSHFRVGGGIKPRQMRLLRQHHEVPDGEQILAVWTWKKLWHLDQRNLVFTSWGVRIRTSDQRLSFPYRDIIKYTFEFIEHDYFSPEQPPLWFLRITGGQQIVSCGPLISPTMFSVLECLNEIKRNVQSKRA
jgi:hypothetical protein